MEDDKILNEALAAFKNGDQGAKNSMIKALQKAGKKWLPDKAFKDHFETGKKIAADRGDTELMMQFWVFGSPISGYEEGKSILVPVIFGDWEPRGSDQKKQMMMGLGLKIASDWPDDQMLTTIVHISEAWMVKRDKEDDIKDITPSEQPDRIEIGLVHALSMDQRISFWQGKILKNDDGSFAGYEDIMNEEFDPEKARTIGDKESFRDHLSEWLMLGYSLGRREKKE